ncbi:MAG TPA: serine--tRNA ligase [bacterium]|nr:serine--tRNA ligase [bacterium]
MLDPKFVRANPDRVRAGVAAKGEKVDLDGYLALDKERLALLVEVDALKAERNRASEEIAAEVKSGGKPDQKIEAMRAVAKRIKEYDERLKDLEAKLEKLILWIPNPPHESVPVGRTEADNKIVRSWGEQPKFDFAPLAHWDIAEALDIVDFKRGTLLSQSNFVVFKGMGARLVRAIINFMLDLHTKKHGYKEVWPPALVNRASMTGTGQLPKLAEDMYHCEVDDLFLIPTAEVPVTNLHRDEILDGAALPLYYTAYTPCFRREAGSYGKDTRGLNRVHQFDKVEMVKFVAPETSYDELEKLVADAEEVLQALGLHYRVNLLCTGELSFSASKCYDLEAWSPAQQKWLEVSSCSNFEDFQARRMGIRYRPAAGEKARLVHTLNGSGIALPRTIIAILETYQTKDGRVRVPKALVPYMDGVEVIE